MNKLNSYDNHIDFLNIVDDALAEVNNNNFAIVIFKLNDIHDINTSYNYNIGNKLYHRAYEWLNDNTRDGDIVHPLTIDKFAVLLKDIKNTGHLKLAANKLIQFNSEYYSIDESVIFSQVTLGIFLTTIKKISSIRILQNAEISLELADKNKTSYEITNEIDEKNEKKEIKSFALKSNLETALENNEFYLTYQPKVNANTGSPVGVEALIRWNNPQLGLVPPDLFIPYLEESRKINLVTDFVLNTALRKQIDLSNHNFQLPISVNFSAISLQQPMIDKIINKAIAIWGNNPSNLALEVTETALMENTKETISILNNIKENGVTISIDDFGTGYSSLSYFKNIPADEVKIDKSFIQNIIHDRADYDVVKTIICLAHDFGHSVVAEGVENIQTWDILKTLNCDVIQGYYFSKPLIYEDLLKWLASHNLDSCASA